MEFDSKNITHRYPDSDLDRTVLAYYTIYILRNLEVPLDLLVWPLNYVSFPCNRIYQNKEREDGFESLYNLSLLRKYNFIIYKIINKFVLFIGMRMDRSEDQFLTALLIFFYN